MMSNALSSFVNINIESHTPTMYYNFSTNHFHESDEYNSDSSSDYSSEYDEYYEDDSDNEGMNSEELKTIKEENYHVERHGNHQ